MELTPELQEKKIFLIEGLKKTYKDQYDAIQPLPYIKDRLYCVDKVFVEGGVEVCLAPELTRGTGGSWERLESYKSIYTDFRFQSKRRIIQGEPGYGKSTLTLQLAYDWCNDVSDSPINNVEILILLRLRQLGSVKTLCKAIKSFLLFREPRVSKHEIEKIINSCSSVHITLDGYDEYPGSGSDDTDYVHRIINMELFADFDVSLTTRYLPESLREETKRAKLTGFDDKARDEYIRKAVVDNNDEAVEKIKQRLYENSILADLCQVPLVFVMFAHMAHDERDCKTFKSVTQFFKHIIRCFYNHLKRKRKLYDSRNNRFYLHEMEHHELDKIAFEGLNKKNQQLSWIKAEFHGRVGIELYDQYISIGILVEEDVVSDDSTVDNVLFTTMVRFYHKLFCEWYAAHHLVTLVKNAYDIKDTLRFLDPFDLQYLFRFACGLDPDAGKKLINHLKSLPGGDTFAILCILEQTGDVNEIMDSVKDLCSRDVKIKRGDSALLQRSTTQLLEIASKNDVPISCLHLDYSSIKFEGDTIILHSGISLPKLPTVEKIHIDGSNEIYDNTGTLTDNDIVNLFYYGMKCRRIKELMFGQLQLPTSVSPEAFTDTMKTRNIQVRWRPFDIDFHLDLQSGQWEVDDNRVLENIRFSTVSIDGRVLQHISTVQLLHVAHRHNIPISTLLFSKSFKRADNGTIILNTGIRITNLPPLQKIHDVDNIGCNAITEQDIANILKCVMKGQHFNELCFEGWLMPVSLSSALTNWMLSLALNVWWRPFDKDFRLDLQTGHWEVVDNHVMEHIRSSTVSIDGHNSKLQQRSTVQLLHLAHRHNIPISCLNLCNSFSKIDAGSILLHSELRLSCPASVKKVVVKTYTQREITETEVIDILMFVQQSHMLEELEFDGCLLPLAFSSESIPAELQSRKIKVFWSNYGYSLDLQSGFWEVHDIDTVRELCTKNVGIYCKDSELLQRCTIKLLENASNHDIPISCLHLYETFSKIDAGDVILHSGLRLSCPVSVKKVVINTFNEGREMTETEVVDILMFLQHSRLLEELMFSQLQLPTSVSPEAFTDIMKTRNIQVRWRPFDIDFHLDLQSGHWEVIDIQVLENIRDSTVCIDGKHSLLQQRSTVELLHAAHRHNVPISTLLFSESFQTIDNGIIILNNGIRVTNLPPLQKMYVVEKNNRNPRAIKDQDIANILLCVIKGQHFNEICFEGWLMPVSLSSAFTNWILSRALVLWRPFDNTFRLDLQTGHWEVVDNQVMEHIRDSTVSIDGTHSMLQQRSTVQLLHVAHRHNIPISTLLFSKSFKTTAHETIILNNGIQLTNLPPLQKIHDVDNNGCNEITEQDIANILLCVIKGQHFNEMCFEAWLLPVSFSSAFTNWMLSLALNVLWRPFDNTFRLDLQTGHWEVVDNQVMEHIRDSSVSIDGQNSKLQQRSTVQLLHVAHRHNIPISTLLFSASFRTADNGTITLNNGIRVTNLPPLQKIHVVNNKGCNAITDQDIANILLCVIKGQHFNEICVEGWLMPVSLSSALTHWMLSLALNVLWRPFDNYFRLDLQTGHWEVVDNQVVENIRYSTVSIDGKHSVLQQRSTVQLLHVAHRYNIPISSLLFNESFNTTDNETIILNNGIQLTNLPQLQKMHVVNKDDCNTSEITEQDVVNILLCAMKDQHFNSLCFEGCRLPVSFSSSSFTNVMISRAIKVSWCPFDSVFHLDLQTGLWEVDDNRVLENIRSSTVSIDCSVLQQRSTVQLLHVAHRHNIPISGLYLKESFSKIDAGNVILHSGLRLSCPVSVEKVVIDTRRRREMTETEVVDILMFVQQSHMLEELEFGGCLLPLTFSLESIPAELQSKNIKVFWSNYGYRLNLQSGLWEVDDVDTVKRLCTEKVDFNREFLQRFTIKLLENASNHDIPISCLFLDECFSKIDAGDVILFSGLRLSCPATVKKVVINTEEGREMTETEVVDILKFVQKSHLLEVLEFDGCLLPSISSSEAIPAEFKTRDIKVLWISCGYSLNFQSGAWEVDVDTVKCLCTKEVEISDDDSDSRQRYTIQLLENASAHDIPISCLNLNDSYCKIDAGDVILDSGLRLSCPVSVKKVVICTYDAEREMTEAEVVDILMFVQHSHMLEELTFSEGELPESIPAESIPSILKSRNVKVAWQIHRTQLQLNFQSGQWMDVDMVRDENSLTGSESESEGEGEGEGESEGEGEGESESETESESDNEYNM